MIPLILQKTFSMFFSSTIINIFIEVYKMNRYIIVKVFGVKHLLENDMREEKNPIFLIFDTQSSIVVGSYKIDEKDALSESNRLNKNDNPITLSFVINISNDNNSDFTNTNVMINIKETNNLNTDLELDSQDIIFDVVKDNLITILNNLFSPNSNFGMKI